jgi:hypothetical protein
MAVTVENHRRQVIRDLNELWSEIMELATDRDIYWKVQHEVIQKNARLLSMRSAFFDIMNNAYAHSMASRVRRLVDRRQRTLSLRTLIEWVMKKPDLWHGKFTLQDLKTDLVVLDKTCTKVKRYVDQFIAHHDRSSSAAVPTHKDLNNAVDKIVDVFRRYHVLLTGSDIEPVLQYLEHPLAIFTFPWLEANGPNGKGV